MNQSTVIDRNVVMVTIDCLRYDRCGFNGYHRNTTPTLDSLSCSAWTYRNAFAPGPTTADSLPGILSGRLSADCSAKDGHLGIPAETDTIASALRNKGFDTSAVITNPGLSRSMNISHGFDYFYNFDTKGPTTGSDGDMDQGLVDRLSSLLSEKISALNSQVSESIRQNKKITSTIAQQIFLIHRFRQYYATWPTERAPTVIDSFIDTLDSRETPFFAWTHLMDLHCPIHPKEVSKGGLSPSSDPKYCFETDRNRLAQRPDSRYSDLYDSTIRAVDDQIGRIIDWLKQNDHWSDTVLVVTSDHGEALMSRGIYSHKKHYMFDELLKIPLLVRVPDDTSSSISEPTSLCSLHRILADALGTGKPLIPDSEDTLRMSGETIIFSDSLSSSGHTVVARSPKYKFITHKGEGIRKKYTWMPRWEWDWTRRDTTFRIQCDPGEHVPQDGDEAPDELREAAKEKLTEPRSVPSLDTNVSPEVERRLQELGYRD